jgi:hypothetical protein
MAMMEINKNPSAKELMWFGILLFVFAAGVGSWLYFGGSPFAGQLVYGIGGGLGLVFFAVRPAQRCMPRTRSGTSCHTSSWASSTTGS